MVVIDKEKMDYNQGLALISQGNFELVGKQFDERKGYYLNFYCQKSHSNLYIGLSGNWAVRYWLD